MLWGIVVNAPNSEPITSLLDDHRYLTRNKPFKPSLVSTKQLNQSLDNLSHRTTEDVKTRPNFSTHLIVNSSINFNQALFWSARASANVTARIQDIGRPSAESSMNLIVLMGLANKLPQAKALFKTYK
ncbi:hypothetical protein PGT21_000943 [Puccinia graminis f. sp. tritici]|uniref:Uncharacterized protein n=1 Tax=Puccinia graminis f. sp. tritici TaxID=56615 RepID=A0A5B0LJC9_PUCGR|nr:hypothetical protein PGT21_000943 [Puccinia graminis f. sp. tritici]